jgi:DNA-binding GntR family transcriptional regulator
MSWTLMYLAWRPTVPEVELPALSPIEFADGRPFYRQIAEQLRNLIRDGHLAPGDRVPSEHEMVNFYGCSRGTVRQARFLLELEGWIETIRGRGAFVRVAPPR